MNKQTLTLTILVTLLGTVGCGNGYDWSQPYQPGMGDESTNPSGTTAGDESCDIHG